MVNSKRQKLMIPQVYQMGNNLRKTRPKRKTLPLGRAWQNYNFPLWHHIGHNPFDGWIIVNFWEIHGKGLPHVFDLVAFWGWGAFLYQALRQRQNEAHVTHRVQLGGFSPRSLSMDALLTPVVLISQGSAAAWPSPPRCCLHLLHVAGFL